MRKKVFTLLSVLLAGAAVAAPPSTAQETAEQALGARYEDLEWQPIVPELGADSPEVSILRVDPVTRATQLLIHVPKRIHVPTHWHSANETHTVIRGSWTFEYEGVRHDFGPGGFNYIPAEMRHQAWASDDALVFITVDSAWDINWVGGPPVEANLGRTPDAR